MKNTTPIIGIEVHVELTTNSKMFCGCPADHFGKSPNTQTCPVCLGLPGALPVPNQKAIEDTIKIGLALNCEINEETHFDRKQYFYPDLAKGYQISQYDQPLSHDGFLTLDSGKKIRIERVHLEEDTGKLQHTILNGERVSLIDFNRCGVPLVEIVSMPDISSTEEAKEYLKKIHQIVREIKVTTADLEKGQMRLEPTVNVKITDASGEHLTPLVELKNINSFNFATLAIDYEVKRLVAEFEKTGFTKKGGNKSTRGYDSVKKVTFPQRQKEEANDYRYFPEPDIPPLRISNSVVEKIRTELPALPDVIIENLVVSGVKLPDAKIISKDRLALEALTAYPGFDQTKLASFIVNKKIDISGNITSQYRKLTQIGETDTGKLSAFVEKVITDNPKVVEEYKKGKTGVLGFLVGQVMKLSGGKADPKTVSTLLLEKL
ncbi:hypothetical protein A3A84_00410 [Candidatus Collierbacteria bacterium RIFCSPLOWO2_01_FULL_50_23]|uniref:Aspartyl/glutamyl-tRNA(Asn/Gln) amidotransferase subunit B n=2 Tax=Candidatus Collieribacteriota TaxID=1752725 RepID=A0A1F5ES69_9BACT|nr:MAG: hypothetical protein A3D09_03515 [Candidatus Collierbacteria bacterium RIFCSPHIGHO2_02_FULL_49_10]OGD71414.1 MAG: hypothetical protein A2703_04080 [Candidatus Collierbacteria bacterium RIFCSPHIGHO2_01_FULL_50_25]OGD74092.1 MAG: hypothetical protein A3A84_00410 [Candidatus Collierbacteria bacterium RIFCSPLOWO2_01_FULL_50_23]